MITDTRLMVREYEGGRSYQLRYEICPASRFSWERCQGSTPMLGEWNGLLESIASIAGVVHIEAKNYEIYIGKGGAFTWEEIEEPLKKILAMEQEARAFTMAIF